MIWLVWQTASDLGAGVNVITCIGSGFGSSYAGLTQDFDRFRCFSSGTSVLGFIGSLASNSIVWSAREHFEGIPTQLTELFKPKFDEAVADGLWAFSSGSLSLVLVGVDTAEAAKFLAVLKAFEDSPVAGVASIPASSSYPRGVLLSCLHGFYDRVCAASQEGSSRG